MDGSTINGTDVTTVDTGAGTGADPGSDAIVPVIPPYMLLPYTG